MTMMMMTDLSPFLALCTTKSHLLDNHWHDPSTTRNGYQRTASTSLWCVQQRGLNTLWTKKQPELAGPKPVQRLKDAKRNADSPSPPPRLDVLNIAADRPIKGLVLLPQYTAGEGLQTMGSLLYAVFCVTRLKVRVLFYTSLYVLYSIVLPVLAFQTWFVLHLSSISQRDRNIAA